MDYGWQKHILVTFDWARAIYLSTYNNENKNVYKQRMLAWVKRMKLFPVLCHKNAWSQIVMYSGLKEQACFHFNMTIVLVLFETLGCTQIVEACVTEWNSGYFLPPLGRVNQHFRDILCFFNRNGNVQYRVTIQNRIMKWLYVKTICYIFNLAEDTISPRGYVMLKSKNTWKLFNHPLLVVFPPSSLLCNNNVA